MTRRITTALIGFLILFLGFAFEPLSGLLVVATALIGALCTIEVTQMMRRKGLRVYRRVATWGVVVLILEAYLWGMEYSAIVFGLLLCWAWLVRLPGKIEGAWADLSATAFTLAYIGLPLAAVTTLFMGGAEGKAWLLLMLFIIWSTDTFALFVGKRLGRHKLCPRLSPGKTWEGCLGGLVGALAVALLFVVFFGSYFPSVRSWEWLLIGLLFSVIGMLGDLAESLLKRDVGVKDSGSPLTGHGGFLDLMDAALFAAIPLLAYVEFFHPQVLP